MTIQVWQGLTQTPLFGVALTLAAVTLAAMALSCLVAGLAGSLVPVLLRRVGADPATASSIFLTSLTDATSMGSFLLLATWLVL